MDLPKDLDVLPKILFFSPSSAHLNVKDRIKAIIIERETTNVSVKELSENNPTAIDQLHASNGNGNYLKAALIGLLMGAAEVVPGVSGGTIAFITGIYERLTNAIKQFTPVLLLRLKDEGFIAVWRAVDASFLLALFGGMGVSIILFARGISYLLVEQPIFLWSFFFGLVIASTWIVVRQISRFGYDLVIFAIIGTSVGMLVTTVIPLQLSPTAWFLFVGGAIAVCAWILPGLSGSYFLLILGLYGAVIDAIKNFELELLLLWIVNSS